jgi:integrase
MPLKLYRRGNIWHYRGTVNGKRARGSCKTSEKSIAARQVSEIESGIWKGHFDGPSAVLTFRRACAQYRKTGKSARFLDRIEAYFGDTLVKDIKAGMIQDMANVLYPKAGMAARNRQGITPAQAVINHCAKSELCSPIRVERFKAETKEREPVDLDWINAFCKHANPQMEALALFMFLTGARVGEALAIKWPDVNFEKKDVLIRQTKVASERRAHLPQRLIVALANLERMPGRNVFGYQHPDDIWRAWEGAIKKAGIKRLTPHCCRHGFATGLIRAGVDVVTVAKLGGWKNVTQVLKTYGHARDDKKLVEALLDTTLTQTTDESSKTSMKIG